MEQIDNAPVLSAYDNMNRLTSQSPGGVMRFSGTINEAATVTIQGLPATVTSDNEFERGAQVSSGTSQVVVKAKDYAGNERTNTYEVSVSGSSKTFTFDANGSMTGDGARTFEWDAENRLITVKEEAATLASLVYNGVGQRLEKTASGVTTSYVYDHSNHLVEERLSTGGTIRYWYGLYVDDVIAKRETDDSIYYYTKDHLGSVRETTTSDGNISVRRDYDPWGNALAGQSTSGIAFTARVWDPESQIYDYRARFYDPSTGRFLSEDPTGLAEGANRYRYALNSPGLYVDPFGTQPEAPPGESFPGGLTPEQQKPLKDTCEQRLKGSRPVSFEIQPKFKGERVGYFEQNTDETWRQINEWRKKFEKACLKKSGDKVVRNHGYTLPHAFMSMSVMVCCQKDPEEESCS